MNPDAPQAYRPQLPKTTASSGKEDPYVQLAKEFVGEVRSQLSTLTGEIALRNRVIMTNDSYVYGDLLQRSLDVPVGHDFTPVNWLRRTAEIHRTQTMGEGFTVQSSYHGVDVDKTDDPNEKKQLQILNGKKKTYAEARNKLFDSILRDNGGKALFARMVENGSVIGTSVLKAWYDPEKGKYVLDMIEAVEHFYAIWQKNDFRNADLYAYVYQISKQQAVEQFNVPPDVATSPLGHPLAVLSSANTVEYISTQPMVTVMEIQGRAQGWGSTNGRLKRVDIGQENELNAVIVGDRVKKLEDNPKYMPKFYIFPNKLMRRRPWGLPDITESAIAINQTYIETLSDWRTVASKVNFPKYKAFGFGMDTQLPKPKARTVEMIGLGEGQDIQPIQNPQSELGSESDFQRQLMELKEAFVRETGISMQLFDLQDASNSNQASLTGMKSISDQVLTRRQLWSSIIAKVFSDALDVLKLWDENIRELVEGDEDWFINVVWPPSLRKDDPAFQQMILNRFLSGTVSVQSFMERMGENAKEEIDRINDEMDNPITAAIHGHMLNLLAEYKIAGPPSMMPPKVNVNLRGDITPGQEGNLAYVHGFNNGPLWPPEAGPQGQLGMKALDNSVNNVGGQNPFITGQGYTAGQPITQPPPSGGAQANPPTGANPPQNAAGGGGNPVPQPTQPQMISSPSSNAGQGIQSQPGSGQATPNSAKGNIAQQHQRKGKK